MKKAAYYVTFSLLVLGGLFVQGAQAQSSSTCPRLVATIPFEFKVGKATLPPGDYEIQCSSSRTDSKVLQLTRGQSVRAMVQASAVMGKSGKASTLVFNRYGNEYFLDQLWVTGEQTGMQLRKSDAEKNLSRQIAQTRERFEMLATAPRR